MILLPRLDQFPDSGQMVVVVLGGEIKVIHQSHRLPEPRVQHRARKRVSAESLNAIQQLETRLSELAENLVHLASVVACFVRLAIGQICRSQLT